MKAVHQLIVHIVLVLQRLKGKKVIILLCLFLRVKWLVLLRWRALYRKVFIVFCLALLCKLGGQNIRNIIRLIPL